MTIHDKFLTTRRELAAALIEREDEITLALTALVAREHCLLVGPPGTAKSMLANALTAWLDGAQFTVLLTKYTTPEEVFGPISLAGLKADHYRRITAGRLPTADIGFIDEIFKASSAILNTLLTVLNERLFDNDGTREICPLQLCIAASNEFPGSNGDGKELGALFDRFIFRREVKTISTERGLQRLLWTTNAVALSTRITPEEISTAQQEAAALPFTDDAKEAFSTIHREAKASGIIPGDRRLRKAVTACRASAWLAGHTQVEKEDLEILTAVLWDDPTEQPQTLAKIVGKIANPAGMRVNGLLTEAEQIIATTELRDLSATATACKKLGEIHAQLKALPGDRAALGTDHVAQEIKRIRLATVEAL